jgi:hypothetical protein
MEMREIKKSWRSVRMTEKITVWSELKTNPRGYALVCEELNLKAMGPPPVFPELPCGKNPPIPNWM